MAAKGNGMMMPDDWQARNDMETLVQAHKIKSDKKRHAAAKAHAKKQLSAMQGIMGEEAAEGETGKPNKKEEAAERT